jgi:RNA polymerase sigma factor (sigma-70 family)
VEASVTHRAIEAVWRIESAKLIATLTRLTGDVGAAEDLAQDALVAAMEQWPRDGVPDNAGAWLTAIAKRKAIDSMRHSAMADEKHVQVGRELDDEHAPPDYDDALDDPVGDDLLRLVFMTCHPSLAREGRIALTLRLLGGLTTDEIARAFLVPEPTIAQRIVRAKKTLSEARAQFVVPRDKELAERLASVLEVVYLIFNEGYSATAGADWVRPALCEDALRLGRIVAELMPREPEVHGLVALMELQASRLRTRTDAHGEPVLLNDQDRSRWDQLLIRRGFAALARAEAIAAPAGPYVLQAAIAGCHASARTAAETDWHQIHVLYDALVAVVPSPVVELNRAVAIGMARGPEPALRIIDGLMREPTLKSYHLLRAVRGDLLVKLGRTDEAVTEFRRAAEMTTNESEKRLLLGRAARGA